MTDLPMEVGGTTSRGRQMSKDCTESSGKAPLSGCYEIFGVPHLDEANGPPLAGKSSIV